MTFQFSEEHNIAVFETSAKSNKGIDEVMISIIRSFSCWSFQSALLLLNVVLTLNSWMSHGRVFNDVIPNHVIMSFPMKCKYAQYSVPYQSFVMCTML